MTYTGAEYSMENLFRQLKRQVRDENISSYDQYTELVDTLIEEKKSYGFLADEEDLQQIRRDLELRWHEVEQQTVR